MPIVDWICSVVGLLSLGGEPTVSRANAKPTRHTNAGREREPRGDDEAALAVSAPQHIKQSSCGLVEMTAHIWLITSSRL